jgi:hypothetical protein
VESLTDPQSVTPQQDFKEKSEKIKAILDVIVSKNEDKKALDGLELLMRLVNNVVTKPTE